MLSEKELLIIQREINAKNKIHIIQYIKNKYYKLSDLCCSTYFNKHLNNKDFTIISNNCWGGCIYEHYNLPKLSPTVGLYFFADDYLKFTQNLRYYISLDLEFIPPEQSKYKEVLRLKGQDNRPIGILDDVELVFVHYTSQKDAKDKWTRRIGRINWNNVILKISEMNLCSYQHLLDFNRINGCKKVIFTNHNYKDLAHAFYIPQYSKYDQLLSDIHEYRTYMKDIEQLINAPICGYGNNMENYHEDAFTDIRTSFLQR